MKEESNMKMVLLSLLVFGMVLTLFGCARENASIGGTEQTEALTAMPTPAPQTAPDEPTEAAEDEVLAALPRYGGAGDYDLTVLDDKSAKAVGQDYVAGSDYPIFVDPYPVGQGGPSYEITQEIIARQETSLEEYLTLLYGTGDYGFSQADDSLQRTVFEDSDISVRADANGLTVSSSAYPVGQALTAETLNDNPLLRAALDYLDIESPRLLQSFSYGYDGQLLGYSYQIFETEAESLADACSRSFSSIRVNVFVGVDDVIIKILNVTPSRTEQTVRAVSEEDLDTYISAQFPDFPPEDYRVEVYYDKNVQPGFYVPCYRVYLAEAAVSEQLEVPVYTVLSLANSELMASSPAE